MSELFVGTPPLGIVALPEDGRLVAAAAGVRLLSIDLGTVVDKASLMDVLVQELELPGYFGRNWDALLEVLTDEDIVGDRAALVLSGLAALAARAPGVADTLGEVMVAAQEDSAATGRSLWLVDADQEPVTG